MKLIRLESAVLRDSYDSSHGESVQKPERPDSLPLPV